MSDYIKLHAPVSFGSDELDPVNAYFLGAILSANEKHEEHGKIIWLAPYRHNFTGYANHNNIREHIGYIKNILKRANGKILSAETLVKKNWFPPNKQGFAVAFESPAGTTVNDLIACAGPALNASCESVARCFLVGAFDGRSSIDHNKKENKIRYLSLDCNNPDVADLLGKVLTRFGFGANNYNTSRDRLEGGLPRKNQFRIPSEYALRFIKIIGMICPARFEQFKDIFPNLYERREYGLLSGLKTLFERETLLIPEEVKDFNDNAELQADRILLEEIDDAVSENFYGGTEISYKGLPQKKCEPIIVNGHKSYKRDKTKSLNALVKAHCKCEISPDHPSFIRKNSDKYYMEPHHLIPLCFYDDFNVSLDIEENIVCLCSNCHNRIHYGRDVRPLLEKLFNERKNVLAKAGIVIGLEDLFKMYNA